MCFASYSTIAASPLSVIVRSSHEVVFNKSGFQKGHPEAINRLVYDLCYITRFDQELNLFQLKKNHWSLFKTLFESVTGFDIWKDGTCEDGKYVSRFFIDKNSEVITSKNCSAGEKKIMKSFSTLLNLETIPSIILVDNVGMHVERGRHISLIKAMKKCYPDSQLITTTHSYHICRNFSEQNKIYDLRFLNYDDIFKSEPWRLQIFDEINDALIRLDSCEGHSYVRESGKDLLRQLNEPISDLQVYRDDLKTFISNVNSIYIERVVK